MLTSETIQIAGRNQQVFRGGKGPTLIWLHGVNVVTAKDPMLLELAKSHAVIAPVMPGYNDLAEIKELRDIHDLALYYDDVFDALDLKVATVVGHSFGAMVAAELAAHVPDRVGRLVLFSPLGLWNDAYPVTDIFARPYPEIDTLVWQGAGKGKPAAPAGAEKSERTIDELVALIQGLTTVTQYVWPIPDKGLGRRLYRIKAPTLVVFGENDAVVSPRYADDFVAGLPNAVTKLVPQASHMVPYEDTARTIAMISEFLKAS